MKIKHFTFFIFLFLHLSTSAHDNELNFIKNLGQWDSKVNYKVNLQGGHLFIENQTLTYVFHDAHNLHHIHELEHEKGNDFNPLNHKIDAYAFKVDLLNSNDAAIIEPHNQRKEYYNYFIGNDSNKWAEKVPLYKDISYKSIYNGIDLNLYSKGLNLKYDFIVSPNSDPNQIQLKYNDAEQAQIINGALHIDIGFNTIIEQKPFAYQNINGKKIEVKCSYVFNNNILSFEFPNGYDPNHELIIDPELIAATLSGSTATNYGHSATYDNEGNIYTGARNFGVGYPATTGAFQLNYGGGGTDIAISKLNPDGSELIWASYIGGNSDEYPHSMFVHNNELYVMGSSNSPNYPTTSNAFDNTNNNTDIIITHFSSDGSNLIGSTFIGGSGIDGYNNNNLDQFYDQYRGEIIVDNEGNAIVSNFSQSADFPVTTGAYQTTLAGGQDGVVFKITPDLSSLIWSTYIGGTGNDSAYSLRLANNGNVYVTGSAANSSFPTTNNAAISDFIGGEHDGFILELASDGSTIINSTFFGSDAQDQSYFIDLDSDGDVYIYGRNEGIIPISPSCYGNENSAQFIAKFDSNLENIIWQTTIGSGALTSGDTWTTFDFNPVAFMVDVCKKIYISGFSATSNLFVSEDPIQATGGFYEMVLEEEATAIHYATYYTGDHVDGGTSRFDPNGIIYQAVCSGGGFATTTEAFATNQSPSWDIAVFKIELVNPILSATASAEPSTSGCAPFSINFNNSSSPGAYIWNFDDGNTSSTTNPSHTFENEGIYNVELVVVDSATCSTTDTLILPIEVIGGPDLDLGEDILICQDQSVIIEAISEEAESYLWQDNSTGQSILVNTPGTYSVEASNNGECTSTESIEVALDPYVLDLGENIVLCENAPSINIDAGSDAISYLWSTGENTQIINVTEGEYSVLAISNVNCEYEDEIEVELQEFNFDISTSSVEECDPALITFNDLSTVSNGEISNWYWDFGVETSIEENTSVNYTNPGLYDVTLIIGTEEECFDTLVLSQHIQINPNPSANFEYSIEFQNNCDIGVKFNNQSESADAYFWNFNDGEVSTLSNPLKIFEYNQQFEVELQVENEFSCKDTIIKTLEIPKFKPVFVPNVFTPNTDSKNDLFHPISACIKEIEFYIYDRWGKLVFYSEEIDKGWDGRFENADLKNGSYTWRLRYDHDGELIDENGFVILIR